MTPPTSTTLGMFVIPATVAADLGPQLADIKSRSDDAMLDELGALFLAARAQAADAFTSAEAGHVACWTKLSTFLRDRLGTIFDPPLLGADQITALQSGLKQLAGDKAMARLGKREHHEGAVRAVFDGLQRMVDRAAQDHAGVFAGRYHVFHEDEDDGDDIPLPSPPDIARFERWLEEPRGTDEPLDWYGLVLLHANDLAEPARLLDEAARASASRQVELQSQAFAVANVHAVDATLSNDEDRLGALYEVIDWLTQEIPDFHGFAAYSADTARALAAHLAELSHKRGDAIGALSGLKGSRFLPATRIAVYGELQSAFASAAARDLALVLVRHVAV